MLLFKMDTVHACMLSPGVMEVSWAVLRGLTWKFRQIKEDGAFLCYWEWTHKSGSQLMAGDGKSWVDNQTLSLSFPVHCSPNHCDIAGQTISSHLSSSSVEPRLMPTESSFRSLRPGGVTSETKKKNSRKEMYST